MCFGGSVDGLWCLSVILFPWYTVASVNCLVGEQSDLPRTIFRIVTDFPEWPVNCLVASL